MKSMDQQQQCNSKTLYQLSSDVIMPPPLINCMIDDCLLAICLINCQSDIVSTH